MVLKRDALARCPGLEALERAEDDRASGIEVLERQDVHRPRLLRSLGKEELCLASFGTREDTGTAFLEEQDRGQGRRWNFIEPEAYHACSEAGSLGGASGQVRREPSVLQRQPCFE